MKTPKIAIALGYGYVFIALLRWLIEVPTLFIALLSIAAALFTLQDFLSEVLESEKWSSRVFGGSLLFLVTSIVSLLFDSQPSESLLGFVQRAGDFATLLGLGVVVITIGYKEKAKVSRSEPIQDKQVSSIDIVKQMSDKEYTTMMELNDVVTRLKKIDPQVFGYGQVHNGWSVFYDILVDVYNSGGPFYDGLNRQLFREFLKSLDDTTEIITTLADPEPGTYRDLNSIVIWDIEIEIYSQHSINYRGGPTVQDAVTKLAETLKHWETLKVNVTKQYEHYRVN
ncbi:hypothetical protein ACPV3A_29710 [Paenibacillus sp. Dod16]|uniref:hypothetical protein n=1 Tax=Paenibacillus sp. Dod16 TaxID=3416392 RepID=UPI003CE9149E